MNDYDWQKYHDENDDEDAGAVGVLVGLILLAIIAAFMIGLLVAQ